MVNGRRGGGFWRAKRRRRPSWAVQDVRGKKAFGIGVGSKAGSGQLPIYILCVCLLSENEFANIKAKVIPRRMRIQRRPGILGSWIESNVGGGPQSAPGQYCLFTHMYFCRLRKEGKREHNKRAIDKRSKHLRMRAYTFLTHLHEPNLRPFVVTASLLLLTHSESVLLCCCGPAQRKRGKREREERGKSLASRPCSGAAGTKYPFRCTGNGWSKLDGAMVIGPAGIGPSKRVE